MPANAHRARHLGWCLHGAGWEAEVLAPSRDFQQTEWLDEKSDEFFPARILCNSVPPPRRSIIQRFGARSMAWRALLPMYRRGCDLLATGRFDLVYITTTVFNFFCLGRMWRRRFGVPYVLDFHDPWYQPDKDTSSTNHRFKAWVSNRLARYMEAYAVRGAAGLVAVSPNYLAELQGRYPQALAFRNGNTNAIPFGVLARDLELVSPGSDGQRGSVYEIAYVGVGAEIMAKSFRRIAEGMARLRLRQPGLTPRIRLRLSGTDGRWKAGGPKILKEQAVAAGVGDLVEEDPRIVSYRVALTRATTADGLLVLGVDDPAYMPSKLFLYALTGKPLLACMHRDSQVNDYFRRFPELGTLIHFGDQPETQEAEDQLLMEFLTQVAERQTFLRENIRREFSAAAMARRHAELFEKVVASDH